jgi:hypothetical protein
MDNLNIDEFGKVLDCLEACRKEIVAKATDQKLNLKTARRLLCEQARILREIIVFLRDSTVLLEDLQKTSKTIRQEFEDWYKEYRNDYERLSRRLDELELRTPAQ